MAKPEWGMKRTCQSCGARFYDLRRSPIVCPICQAAFDPERQLKPRRAGSLVKDEPVLAGNFSDEEGGVDTLDEESTENDSGDRDAGSADDDEGDDEIDDLSNDNEELEIEDTSDLGTDVDDLGEVMDHVDDESDDKA